MKKIKWGNVIKANLLLASIIWILYTSIKVSIGGACFSWFGLITFFYAMLTVMAVTEDFDNQIEKMSATRTRQHLKVKYHN